MTAYVTDAAGTEIQLPTPLSYHFHYTSGIPCDSFTLRCLWDENHHARPWEWCLFHALENGSTVFTGVVDECETVLSQQGRFLELSGRGMAARLLDNEAMGQDYEMAALADILRDHVYPYGIQVGDAVPMAPVSQFSVATGRSEWAVLYDFAQYYHNISPRFDEHGTLILAPWRDEATLRLGPETPVTSLSCRDRRYGVLSQIVVRDRYDNRTETVDNAEFLARGGQRRQILTMPGHSSYQAMRYSGAFQLERSALEQLRLEVEIPIPFYGKPGDLVQLNQKGWGRNGTYRVAEARIGFNQRGAWTLLELVPPDIQL